MSKKWTMQIEVKIPKTQKSISFQPLNPFKQKKTLLDHFLILLKGFSRAKCFFFLNRLSIILQTMFDGHVSIHLFLFCKKKQCEQYTIFLFQGVLTYEQTIDWIDIFTTKPPALLVNHVTLFLIKARKKYIFIASKNTWV